MHHQDKLLLDAASGRSFTKNKTAAEAWEVISDLADSTQHSRARSLQPKALSEVSPSRDAIWTKTLGSKDHPGYVVFVLVLLITPMSALKS
ncbi:hypothetical protein AHAS_Ahas01G0124400 [Arachis hypogaea]